MVKRIRRSPAVLHYICAALMLFLMLLQFMPYWWYGRQWLAINSLWIPTERVYLAEYLNSVAGSANFYEMMLQSGIQLTLEVLGIVMCLGCADIPWISVLPAACGFAGIVRYLTEPALQLGIFWGVHLAVCILIVCVAVMACIPQKVS